MSRSKHEQRPKSWKMNLYVYIEWNFFFYTHWMKLRNIITIIFWSK
jgi:hypothetical protein